MSAVDECSIGAALQAAERQLAEAEQSHGSDSCQICLPLEQLADLYYQDGLYAKAELLFRRAADIWASSDAQAPAFADALSRLAVVYRAQNKLDEAEAVCLRLLSCIAADDAHAELRAKRTCCLAGVYFEKGNYAQCEELLKQASALFEAACGAQSRQGRSCFMALAAVCTRQGKNGEADEYFERSRTLTGTKDDRQAASPLSALIDLCQMYYTQGRFGDVERILASTLLSDEEELFAKHPRVGQQLHERAELFRAQNFLSEAEDSFKKALAVRKQALGPAHPELGNTAFALALLYLGQKRYADAEPVLKLALKTRVRAFGVEHPAVAAGIETFAVLLRNTKRGAVAGKLDARARDIRTYLVAQADRAAGTGSARANG